MSLPILRHKNVFVVCALLALAAMAACAPTSPAPEKAPGAAPEAKQQPKYGGILVYAPSKPIANLHPFNLGNDTDIIRHVGPAYESLLSFDYTLGKDYRMDYKVVPWLAESWEQPNDTTYVFRLRKGVRWHDGEEFTAEDVVFTYNWVIRENFVLGAQLKEIDSLEALDRYTVRITTKAPSALFLETLAGQNSYIVPKHFVEGGGDLRKVALGTGPFKMKSFEPTKLTTWVKNDAYWQPGRPYPDGMKQVWGLDESGMLAAFASGKSDLYSVADKAQLDALLKTKPDAKYQVSMTDVDVIFYPKQDRPPFNDVRVRKAMHLAVDRQAMLKTLTYGEGVINPPAVPGFKKGWAIPQEELLKLPGYRQPKDQDITEAKRLLAEAGYPNGFKTTTILNIGSVSIPRIAEVLAEQVKRVGLDMVLDPREVAAFNKMDTEGTYEGLISTNSNAALTRLVDRLHSKGGRNKSGLSDPKLDELVDTFYRTLDVEKRKRVVLELQHYLLEKVYFIPTIELAPVFVWQPWVHDYYPAVRTTLPSVGQDTVSQFWLDADKIPPER